MNLAKGLDHIIADPSGVRNRRVFPDPDPLVDTPPQMLSKVTVHILVDPLLALICLDNEMIHGYFSFTFVFLSFSGDMPTTSAHEREDSTSRSTGSLS